MLISYGLADGTNVNQQHDKPVFSSSEGPPLKRQKLADTSASSSTTIKNEKKIQSSSNEHIDYLNFNEDRNGYNFVNPNTTPQVSFADIHPWLARSLGAVYNTR